MATREIAFPANQFDDVPKPRVLIFIVAYEAEASIAQVLARIPVTLSQRCNIDVLIIDDASTDNTFSTATSAPPIPYPLHIFYNPTNLGYGGNQKLGYQFAIEHQFDFVVLLHGDGQYAPEKIERLLNPLFNDDADAVFGSRMLESGAALKNGMPLYKYVGNKILTWFENKMLGTHFSEFHSGYRAYSVRSLSSVPFAHNSDDFHFDTEIIIQFVYAGLRINEQPIPTYYGDEICRVNGIQYALNVIKAVIRARLQKLGLFYSRQFDCCRETNVAHYPSKLDFASTHQAALQMIRPGSRVLELGCHQASLGSALKKQRHCTVVGVDINPASANIDLDTYLVHDLNQGLPDLDLTEFDYIVVLDVIEHLSSPEAFVQSLYEGLGESPDTQVITSTGNIAFAIIRFMLLLGQFNYGKRGILDLTHTRLFTFPSFKSLFEQNGFRIVQESGIPAPYPLAINNSLINKLLLRINQMAINFWRGLCSYQIFMVVQPKPSLKLLLRRSQEASHIKRQS